MTFPNSKQPPDRRFFRGFQQFSNFRHQVVVDMFFVVNKFERFGWTKMKTEMDFFCEIKGFHRVWPKMFQSLRSLNIYVVRFLVFRSKKTNRSLFRWSWSWYNYNSTKKTTKTKRWPPKTDACNTFPKKFRQICPVPKLVCLERTARLANVADELDDDLRIHISWSCLFFTGGGLPNRGG